MTAPCAYYNEIDPGKAAWLRNLIDAGLIAPGEVDTRSIVDVAPADLLGFAQCHFFAGIGVWSYALRLAGWPDERPVWTGSCPCQPFSLLGKREGTADERHLAPAWLTLVHQCAPQRIYGEQVASAIREGWLDALQDDLEAHGYAVGSTTFPACSVGAPHERQRLYFGAQRLADVLGPRLEGHTGDGRDGDQSRRLDADAPRSAPPRVRDRDPHETNGFWRDPDWLLCRDDFWRPVEPGSFPMAAGTPARVLRLHAYGDAIVAPQAAAFIEAFDAACHEILGEPR